MPLQAAADWAALRSLDACARASKSALFEGLAKELDVDAPGFVDLRDRVGWGEGDSTPKMAALALPLGKSVAWCQRAPLRNRSMCA